MPPARDYRHHLWVHLMLKLSRWKGIYDWSRRGHCMTKWNPFDPISIPDFFHEIRLNITDTGATIYHLCRMTCTQTRLTTGASLYRFGHCSDAVIGVQRNADQVTTTNDQIFRRGARWGIKNQKLIFTYHVSRVRLFQDESQQARLWFVKTFFVR